MLNWFVLTCWTDLWPHAELICARSHAELICDHLLNWFTTYMLNWSVHTYWMLNWFAITYLTDLCTLIELICAHSHAELICARAHAELICAHMLHWFVLTYWTDLYIVKHTCWTDLRTHAELICAQCWWTDLRSHAYPKWGNWFVHTCWMLNWFAITYLTDLYTLIELICTHMLKLFCVDT